jgi:hypothetical protein
MNLPHYENAFVAIEKLRDYCLSIEHPRGKHKAKVFKSKLGIEASDAEELRKHILELIKENEAVESSRDKYGVRYFVDIEINRKGRKARVRTFWIIRRGETFPRFSSCYVKAK